MYTVTESTKRNDEYFDFVKELDLIKGRRLKCSGGCEICSRGGKSSGGGGRTAAPPEYAPASAPYRKCQFIHKIN